MIRTLTATNTASNAAVKLASRSRSRSFTRSPGPGGLPAGCGLGHPRAGRVAVTPARWAPGAMLDEEQPVQAPQEDGDDVEEGRGEDPAGSQKAFCMPITISAWEADAVGSCRVDSG